MRPERAAETAAGGEIQSVEELRGLVLEGGEAAEEDAGVDREARFVVEGMDPVREGNSGGGGRARSAIFAAAVTSEEVRLVWEEIVVVVGDEGVDVPDGGAVAALDVEAGRAADLRRRSRVYSFVGVLLRAVSDTGEFSVDELLRRPRSAAAELGGAESGGFRVFFVETVSRFVRIELHSFLRRIYYQRRSHRRFLIFFFLTLPSFFYSTSVRFLRHTHERERETYLFLFLCPCLSVWWSISSERKRERKCTAEMEEMGTTSVESVSFSALCVFVTSPIDLTIRRVVLFVS